MTFSISSGVLFRGEDYERDYSFIWFLFDL